MLDEGAGISCYFQQLFLLESVVDLLEIVGWFLIATVSFCNVHGPGQVLFPPLFRSHHTLKPILSFFPLYTQEHIGCQHILRLFTLLDLLL